jgi:hypothetical protein
MPRGTESAVDIILPDHGGADKPLTKDGQRLPCARKDPLVRTEEWKPWVYFGMFACNCPGRLVDPRGC